MFPKFTFVFGGAASGKSAYAEQLVVSSGKTRFYLATSQVFDAEMQAKIDRHILQRGAGWHTIEAPLELAETLSELTADDVCLIDCATMWLSNHLLAESDLEPAQDRLLDAIADTPASVVVVSNEVGHGIVPDNALARKFREAQGRLNIALAAKADLVISVTVGLPQLLKGQLP
ncbi:bifunctional adenosylcobinamide kinase/adenosylcobinamide-phosphate guanylyltransferase [Tropicibacter sp. R16_0]|uniref:bifunctional adenosylcobinamide kinase/adenosylcobinamide-phosphate guanylyltransferase n=1 Tax=Tropicibacter sp. R16_0 TaxID=2821102 RepID=UPI001ADC15F2|nr:bifunctional adenosylcobinamide kinase/adenosylcobinamide-phosphate guanylyltransferase [Tropicibacter sp. R16_0]MBO9450892.1 bifunctional adenosylcobinamide kinase/adenosylcobinamide-phosphate guanylyltransferase [Tropicibacter sp. R16_0]